MFFLLLFSIYFFAFFKHFLDMSLFFCCLFVFLFKKYRVSQKKLYMFLKVYFLT